MHDPATMTNDVQVSIRVPADAPERAEVVAAKIGARPEYQGLRVTRATALRIAMLRGLEVLEGELGIDRGPESNGKGKGKRR